MLCANINRNQKRVYSQQFQNQMKEALGSQSLKKKTITSQSLSECTAE